MSAVERRRNESGVTPKRVQKLASYFSFSAYTISRSWSDMVCLSYSVLFSVVLFSVVLFSVVLAAGDISAMMRIFRHCKVGKKEKNGRDQVGNKTDDRRKVYSRPRTKIPCGHAGTMITGWIEGFASPQISDPSRKSAGALRPATVPIIIREQDFTYLWACVWPSPR